MHYLELGCFPIKYEELFYGDNKKELVYDMFDYVECKIKNYAFIERLLDNSNKINKKSWSEMISNWDEIISFLRKNDINV